MKAKDKPLVTSKELLKILKTHLKGKRVLLDCGHHWQPHNWSNTLIIYADGKTECHNCGY